MHPGPMNRGVEIDGARRRLRRLAHRAAGALRARRADGGALRRAHRRPGRRARSRCGGGRVMLWASEQQQANVVFRGARVLDPAEGIDATLDVRIDDGVIAAVAEKRRHERASGRRRDRSRARTRLRRPARASAHAGPRGRGDDRERQRGRGRGRLLRDPRDAEHRSRSSTPPPTLGALVETAKREARVPVGFLAAITRGQAGEELTEMGELADAGAVAFSDDGVPVVVGRDDAARAPVRVDHRAGRSRSTARSSRCRAAATCTRARSRPSSASPRIRPSPSR